MSLQVAEIPRNRMILRNNRPISTKFRSLSKLKCYFICDISLYNSLSVCNISHQACIWCRTISPQIAKITAVAHQRVKLIFRCFVSRDVVLLVRANTTSRPLLEHNTIVWSPHWNVISTVFKRYRENLPNAYLATVINLNYSKQRCQLNLMTLELRKIHYDIVATYKIVFNIVRLKFNDFFLFQPSFLKWSFVFTVCWSLTSAILEEFFCMPYSYNTEQPCYE